MIKLTRLAGGAGTSLSIDTAFDSRMTPSPQKIVLYAVAATNTVAITNLSVIDNSATLSIRAPEVAGNNGFWDFGQGILLTGPVVLTLTGTSGTIRLTAWFDLVM